MMIRSTIAALLAFALFNGCSADIKEMNRCYAVGKAICKSLRITPEDACIEAINKPCTDAAPSTDTLNSCVDDVKATSGDGYGSCLGGLPSSCTEIWYELSFDTDPSSSDPNSCTYAFDGFCDEGSGCSYGTDTADCADSCQYARNGSCDEGSGCASGTDSTDCDNSCQYAFDGTCDEGSGCSYGTDTADCTSSSGSTTNGSSGFTSGCTATTGDQSIEGIVATCLNDPSLCSIAVTPEPTTTSTTGSSDACRYALDGVCDEPLDCPPGTDTTDCSM